MMEFPIIIRRIVIQQSQVWFETSSLKFASNDTAATGHVGTGGR